MKARLLVLAIYVAILCLLLRVGQEHVPIMLSRRPDVDGSPIYCVAFGEPHWPDDARYFVDAVVAVDRYLRSRDWAKPIPWTPGDHR